MSSLLDSARPLVMRSELRADEYRDKAREATDRARSCGLDRVREQHEAAAASWAALALAEDRRTLAAQVRYPAATSAPSSPLQS